MVGIPVPAQATARIGSAIGLRPQVEAGFTNGWRVVLECRFIESSITRTVESRAYHKLGFDLLCQLIQDSCIVKPGDHR
jgi:hypothetical protein